MVNITDVLQFYELNFYQELNFSH